MRIAGTLVLPQPDRGAVRLVPGWLRLDGQRITEVVEGAPPRDADLGGPGCLISPGFVDAHLHLPQFDSVGAHGQTLLDWLGHTIFPAELAWADADHAAAATHRAIDQLLSHGTTGIGAYATVHHDAATAALTACQTRGLAARVGQVLMDGPAGSAPPGLLRPADELIDQTTELLDRFGSAGRVAAAVTPRFALTASEDLLWRAGTLAAERGAVMQTHFAETRAECDRAAQLHGKRYLQVYRDAGLLGPRSVLAHAVHVDEADRAVLAETAAHVAHCPLANMFLGSGDMDWRAMAEAGASVVLGSDIGAGYDRAMPRVARAALETVHRLGKEPPSAATAWHTITAGNARALGLPETGALKVGGMADVVVLAPTIRWRDTADPLAALLWSWDDRWLTHTLCAGRVAFPG